MGRPQRSEAMRTNVATSTGNRLVRPTRLEPAVAEPDIVEVWGHDSFPASDPPANW
jgi:hypothetical protein